jgi:hypothetical protein
MTQLKFKHRTFKKGYNVIAILTSSLCVFTLKNLQVKRVRFRVKQNVAKVDLNVTTTWVRVFLVPSLRA